MAETMVYRNGSYYPEQRTLTGEVCWKLLSEEKILGTFTGSPVYPEEAALGWLYMHGFLKDSSQMKVKELQEDRIYVEIGTEVRHQQQVTSFVPISPEDILDLAVQLENRHKTWSVHNAALAQGREMLMFREDVSRSCAIDRLAAACLDAGIQTENRILVFSGRVNAEILGKAAKMGCALVIARSAPTDLACCMAEKQGITIVGFAREDSYCIYTCPERLVNPYEL